MSSVLLFGCAVAAAIGVIAPGSTAPAVEVSVRGGRITAPDTVAAGWRRVRVREDGAGHIVVLFRMKQAPDSARLAAFLAALDTARQTPAQAVAIGGPEIGSVGEVTVDLQPGAYVLACVIGGVGHRHAGRGESRVLQVKGPAPAPVLPSARIELGMADYAYTTAAVWPAGAQVIKVSNTGREDHQVRIDRLRPGVTLSKWMAAEDRSSVSEPVIGVARTGPGQTAFLPVKLTRGSYVLYCLVPAAASGTPHAMMGMMRLVTVE